MYYTTMSVISSCAYLEVMLQNDMKFDEHIQHVKSDYSSYPSVMRWLHRIADGTRIINVINDSLPRVPHEGRTWAADGTHDICMG